MSIELFNERAQFVMPSSEAISSLEPEQRERFELVRLAAQAREAAAAATKAAQDHVVECVAKLRAAEADLLEVRPPVSAVDAARAWIRSQQG